MMSHWVDAAGKVSITEHYAVIPYANHMLCLITAPEDELACGFEEWE